MIVDLYTKTEVVEKWRDIVAAFYDMYSIGVTSSKERNKGQDGSAGSKDGENYSTVRAKAT